MTLAPTIGPKYRLSNDAGLVVLKRKSSPARRRRQCRHAFNGRPDLSAANVLATGVPSTLTMSPWIHTVAGEMAPMRLMSGMLTGRYPRSAEVAAAVGR